VRRAAVILTVLDRDLPRVPGLVASHDDHIAMHVVTLRPEGDHNATQVMTMAHIMITHGRGPAPPR
jgi:hypothetical protein